MGMVPILMLAKKAKQDQARAAQAQQKRDKQLKEDKKARFYSLMTKN